MREVISAKLVERGQGTRGSLFEGAVDCLCARAISRIPIPYVACIFLKNVEYFNFFLESYSAATQSTVVDGSKEASSGYDQVYSYIELTLSKIME